MYAVPTCALSARCVLPIRMLPRPRTLRYRRLLSRKRSLSALSQCLSARCHPVFHTLLSRRDSASGQRWQLVGYTCGRLDLCISKTCRWSPLREIPTLTRIHTLVGSHCEPSEKCTPVAWAMYSGRANQILDMPRASSLVGYAHKCP